MALTATIKFAGPDARDMFKCLSVKGRLGSDPGKIYTRQTVDALNTMTNRSKYDVTTIEPKFPNSSKVFREERGTEGRL